VAFLLLFFEGTSFLALSLTEHRWMTWSRVREAQQQARAAAGDVDPAMKLEDVPLPEYITQGAIHPYVGYVLDRSFQTANRLDRGGPDGPEYGFNLVEPRLVHEAAPHQAAIAITGGSVAHNLALHYGRVLRDDLKRLRPDLQRIVLLNLALPGYKKPQQLMSLAWVLSLGGHFDAVVNIDGFNDVTLPITENMAKGVNPFYPRGWYFRAQGFSPELELAAGEIVVLRRTRAHRAVAFERAPWRWSMTASLLWARLDRSLAATIAAREQALLSAKGSAGDDYRVTGPLRRYHSQQEMYRDLVTYWARCSEQMNLLVRANHAVYLHFLQPDQ
jgi:hypothetical protein